MAASAVSTTRSYPWPSGARWFRFSCRGVLALLALWAVHAASGRANAFRMEYATYDSMNVWKWLTWLGAAAAAGLLFGLAAWLPFRKVRYLWSRLLLAALPLAPLAQFWWIYVFQFGHHHVVSGVISRHVWFADPGSQTALAILVGVAIASGLTAERSGLDE
jgi:hypothetical protein